MVWRQVDGQEGLEEGLCVVKKHGEVCGSQVSGEKMVDGGVAEEVALCLPKEITVEEDV